VRPKRPSKLVVFFYACVVITQLIVANEEPLFEVE